MTMDRYNIVENPFPPDEKVVIKKEEDVKPMRILGARPKYEAREVKKPFDVKNDDIYKNAWGALDGDYYCDICEAPMNSLEILRSHLIGKRHRRRLTATSYVMTKDKNLEDKTFKFMNISGGAPVSMRTKQVDEEPKLQCFLDSHRETSIIGLDFLTEIHLLDEKLDPVYQCSLCPADCQLTSVIGHVSGTKHRLSYMRLCEPERYKNLTSTYSNASYISSQAHNYARQAFKRDGRGSIIVEEQIMSQRDILIATRTANDRKIPKYPQSALKSILKKYFFMKDHMAFIEHRLKKVAVNPNLTSEHAEKLEVIRQGLMAKYIPYMFDLALKTREDEISEDLANEKYVDVYQKIYRFDINLPAPKEALRNLYKRGEIEVPEAGYDDANNFFL